MKRSITLLLMIALSAAAAQAADPLASLHFLIGNWNCSYRAGKTHVDYKATFSSDLGGNWLRENDSWAHGGSDLGMITYQPARHGWTSVIVEPERSSFVFLAKGNDANHIVYHSVYPNATATDVFDRQSPTRYTLHFTQSGGGKTMESADVCVKS